MKRVIVYVASPSWNINLYTSILSLVSSGSSFDLIYVISVGGDMPLIRTLDVPIRVSVVDDKSKNYFQGNKTYITKVDAKEMVYLDSDTIIIGELDSIIERSDKKMLARPDSSYEEGPYFNRQQWYDILRSYGARQGPLFNSGFLIFKMGCHKKIQSDWEQVLFKERQKFEADVDRSFPNRSTTEQMSLSISALLNIDEIGRMSREEHRYGWMDGPRKVDKKTIVYHTGSRGGRHIKFASYLSNRLNLGLNKSLISSPTNPLFLKLQSYNFGYRLKHFFNPPWE